MSGKAREALPAKLREILDGMGSLAVAYSGGLDSRFLCHAAALSGRPVLAIHIAGPHVPRRESEAAESWARRNGIPFAKGWMSPLEDEAVASNGKERCHACKTAVFKRIMELARSHGAEGFQLCDGGNLDDQGEWRPGMRAAAELGVSSPLALAGLGKEGIRRLARLTGMENPEQRARPCLLTRFPYGRRPDLELLKRLEQAEAEIEGALAQAGLPNHDFRLRLGLPPILQIQPADPGILAGLKLILERNGFEGCAIIEEWKVSGHFDRGA